MAASEPKKRFVFDLETAKRYRLEFLQEHNIQNFHWKPAEAKKPPEPESEEEYVPTENDKLFMAQLRAKERCYAETAKRLEKEMIVINARKELDQLTAQKKLENERKLNLLKKAAKKKKKVKKATLAIKKENKEDDGVDINRIKELQKFLAQFGVKKDEPYKGYWTFVPDYCVSRDRDSKKSCPGCELQFEAFIINHSERKSGIVGEPSYFIHLTQDCKEYEKLGRIDVCHDCKLIFINRQSAALHFHSLHPKNIPRPVWMPENTYKSYRGLRCEHTVKCVGCGQKFPAQVSSSTTTYSLEYHIHCIEECEEYKKLVLIRYCGECSCKFLNTKALGKHVKYSGHDAGHSPPRPKWMMPKVYRRSGYDHEYPLTKKCKGCGQRFLARRLTGKGLQPRMDFYVHCIKKCKEYKSLGKIIKCSCGFKHINNRSFGQHKCK